MYKKVTIITKYYKVPEEKTLEDLLEPGKKKEELEEEEYDGYDDSMFYNYDEYEGMRHKSPMRYGRQRRAMKAVKAAGVFSAIPNENTEISIKLRMTSRDFFTRYASLLREYVVSKTNKTDDAEKIRNLLLDQAKNISIVPRGWYRIENVNVFTASFEELNNSILDIIDTRVAGGDTAASMARFTTAVSMFTRALNGLPLIPGNPVPQIPVWPEEGVNDIFANCMNGIVRQIDSRIAKDWDGDQSAAKLSFNVLSSGVMPGMTGLADAISKGIIQQNSWRF